MPIFTFNKLVRSKLPQMYADLRQKITTRELNTNEYQLALRDKLVEEAKEIPLENGSRDATISELSDVMQVVNDLKRTMSISDDELEAARQDKFARKGGFLDSVYVETIELEDKDKHWVEYYRAEPNKYIELSSKDKKDVGVPPELQLGTYRHYKGGMYEVLQLACHTETLEWYVVYESQERKLEKLPSVWIRPYSMFVEHVEINDKSRPRFEKLD